MSKPVKSLYLTITKIGAPLKTVFHKQFFNAKDMNDVIKELKKEYPVEEYQYIKENF